MVSVLQHWFIHGNTDPETCTMCSNSSPTDYDDDPFVSDSYLRYHEPPETDPNA
jgi:hypothetical protein